MPTVGLGRQVRPTPLPGAPRTAGETPASEGVGVRQAELQFWGVTEQVNEQALSIVGTVQRERARLHEEATQRADRIGVLNGLNGLHAFTNQQLYTGEDAAYAKKGYDAMGTPETVGAAMDKEIGRISMGLGTARQRALFGEQAGRMRVDVDEGLRRHVLGVIQTYNVEVLQAYATNQQHEAWHNADNGGLIDQAIENATSAMADAADSMGWDRQRLGLEIANYKSATHIGVVQQLLGHDEEAKASAYFQLVGDQITDGPAKLKLQEQLKLGDVLADAQTAVDRIVAQGGTLEEQRAKVKAQFPLDGTQDRKGQADRRERALALVEHEDAVKDREARQAEEQFFGRVYADIYRTGQMPTDAVTLERLGTHLPALENWVKSRAKGDPEKTDYRRWTELMEESIHNKNAFLKRNLYLDRPNLGDTEYKQLELRKAGLAADAEHDAREKAASIVAGFETHNELVKEVLWQYTRTDETKYSSAQKDAKAMLLGQIDHWAAQEQAGGVKVTNEQVRERLHDILSRDTTIPGTYAAILHPFKYDLFDQKKRMIDLTIDDLTQAEQDQMAAALRAGHRAVTPQAILDLYVSIKVAPPKAK